MKCYREGGCGPYENYSCGDCPASRPEYAERHAVGWDAKMPAWISVNDRLPEHCKNVLCVTTRGRPFVCKYDHRWKRWVIGGNVTITHWMPMPEPPEEKS